MLPARSAEEISEPSLDNYRLRAEAEQMDEGN